MRDYYYSEYGDDVCGVVTRTTPLSSHKVPSYLSDEIQASIYIGSNKTNNKLSEYQRCQRNIRARGGRKYKKKEVIK